MAKLVQTVPNYSEGCDQQTIEKILDAFRGVEGVKLLDYSSDRDHNRSVVTVVGEPEAVKAAVVHSVGIAKSLIDMTKHRGQHPRMGAVDVIPFIPIKDMTIEECVELSKAVAADMYSQHGVPVFLYEKSASAPHRENLAKIRKGQFEEMFDKVKDPDWQLDFGSECHPHYGVTAVGARMPLVAFNVLLNTDNLDIANRIARNVRHISGGLRYVKGIGIDMPDRGITQVSMNMTDFNKTPLYRSFELIKIEAARYGVSVIGSEIIGLVPMAAMVNTAEWYLGVENFSIDQVLEKRMME